MQVLSEDLVASQGGEHDAKVTGRLEEALKLTAHNRSGVLFIWIGTVV